MAATQALTAQRSLWRRLSSRGARRTMAFYLFIGPWLASFVLLGIVPLIFGFLTSLTNYDGLNLANIKFLGFRNYTRAFSDKDMLFALSRSAMWSALNTPMWLITSFVMALILNQAVSGRD
ncbi:MAG: sugar ABC transporter permease, partial [Chloroflexi bacterium]|nr:sugar ABC transporter permease [Chloroflexota bacterium]